ncbi:hypothetical protein [Sphingobacterium sp. Mn56C]|uniref:hypothetical protein n=1 Tax=Sphingobacterium sp. Mn56C TaxID=3395261 RepID=UPI003BF4D6A0
MAGKDTQAQEVKKISSTYVSLNGMHPDKFLFEDDVITVKFLKAGGRRIDFELFNKSDKTIDFLWNESYVVLNNQTLPVSNSGANSVKLHTFHSESVDVNKPQKIGPKSNYAAYVHSNNANIIDAFAANKATKGKSGPLINRVVLALLINGAKVEIPISIEVYSKKPI